MNAFSGLLGGVDGGVEQSDSVFESAEESVLFFFDDSDYEFALLLEFGIGFAHRIDECIDNAVHKRLFLSEEGITVSDGATEDAADDVAGFGVGGKLAVGDGEGDGAHMVGDDAHGHIHFVVNAIFAC